MSGEAWSRRGTDWKIGAWLGGAEDSGAGIGARAPPAACLRHAGLGERRLGFSGRSVGAVERVGFGGRGLGVKARGVCVLGVRGLGSGAEMERCAGKRGVGAGLRVLPIGHAGPEAQPAFGSRRRAARSRRFPERRSRKVPDSAVQAIRAANSIPFNLAEGCRRSTREQFLTSIDVALK